MTFDEFVEKYKPIKNHFVEDVSYDGYMFETYDEEFEYVKTFASKNVWILVDAESDDVILPGWHFVNRFGYFITEVPWEDENFEIEVFVKDVKTYMRELDITWRELIETMQKNMSEEDLDTSVTIYNAANDEYYPLQYTVEDSPILGAVNGNGVLDFDDYPFLVIEG